MNFGAPSSHCHGLEGFIDPDIFARNFAIIARCLDLTFPRSEPPGGRLGNFAV